MAKGKKFEAVEVLGDAIRIAILNCYKDHPELQQMSELDYYGALANALDGELKRADTRFDELRLGLDAGRFNEDE